MPKYFKGHVRRADKTHIFQVTRARHTHLNARLAAPTPSKWDSRLYNWVGPVKDQKQCGSCWDFSGTGICEIAYNKVGIGGGANQFILSEEYSLCCYSNGRCNGDDNTTVLDWAKSRGLPLTKDYGGYTAAPGTCKWQPAMPLFAITDWGFASTNDIDSPTVAEVKAAIMQYGSVGCGVAADDSFQDYTGGVFEGSGATQVDHDVILIGWEDSTQSWILRNSWGPDWGEQGYMRIKYGVNKVGDEAVWAVKTP